MPKLIADLAIMMLTAAVVAVVFKRFKLPLVLGYILAGFLVGPFMPYFFTVEDTGSIETWSEIGIIVLMFCLGLEFNLHKLLSVGKTAIVTAFTVVVGMLLVGYLVGQLLGWGMMNSLFLGGMMSMSSTTIIIKAFDEFGVTKERFAQLVFGTLVIEDIAGIFMMIVLATVSVSKSISGGALALKLGIMIVYLAIWLILGIFVLPTILRRAAAFMNDEVLLILSLGICFGMVMLAEHLGFSSALGAFMSGSLLAGTIHAERIEHLTSGIKDLFGAVFFLSVGMLLDPAMIVKYALPILIITVFTICGMLFMSTLGFLLSGQPFHIAVKCGCSLAQVGEFAFIIASLGQSLGVTKPYLYPIIVAVSIITTLTTPFFIKNSEKIYQLAIRLIPKRVQEAFRYNRESSADREQDRDWAGFLKRFFRVTAVYGILMMGVSLAISYLVRPFVLGLPLAPVYGNAICVFLCFVGIGLFIRPMLDMHSTEFTTLWVKDRGNRIPLVTLTVLRFMLIAMIVFFTLQSMLRIRAVWLLLFIVAALFLIYKSGWMASAYISVETHFLANLNERLLQRGDDEGEQNTEWLDETLLVDELVCSEASSGRTLKQLNWGKLFSVNVIKVIRGRKHHLMPSGSVCLEEGDRVIVIGKPEDIRSFHLRFNLDQSRELKTLRHFIEAQPDDAAGLACFALPVDRDSKLNGVTIRESHLREDYDCMILGLQRDRLPILQPDVNLTIQRKDLVWVLTTGDMAEKLLLKEI